MPRRYRFHRIRRTRPLPFTSPPHFQCARLTPLARPPFSQIGDDVTKRGGEEGCRLARAARMAFRNHQTLKICLSVFRSVLVNILYCIEVFLHRHSEHVQRMLRTRLRVPMMPAIAIKTRKTPFQNRVPRSPNNDCVHLQTQYCRQDPSIACIQRLLDACGHAHYNLRRLTKLHYITFLQIVLSSNSI